LARRLRHLNCEKSHSISGATPMRLDTLAERIGATLVVGPAEESVEIDHIYAGDRMSDLLSEVTDGTLVVTNLSHMMLMRPIELMDVPGLCLVNGAAPDAELVDAAKQHGAAVLVSPYGMFETCGRLYQVFSGGAKGRGA